MVEIFHIRKLLWEEIKPHIKASEIEELRFAIGSKLLDENEVLPQVLNFPFVSHDIIACSNYA
jgi:hypothetical protein